MVFLANVMLGSKTTFPAENRLLNITTLGQQKK